MKASIMATWPFGEKAASVGMAVLKRGGSALDAIEESIKAIEDDPTILGVGLGGLPNLDGVSELDASIMDGGTLRAGAVGGLRSIRHPISVARKVMELTPHILLIGEGALSFAKTCGFKEEQVWKPDALEQWKQIRGVLEKGDLTELEEMEEYARSISALLRSRPKLAGTVSVVALDREGSMVAGNSTTGLALKLPGRVGDSAIVGAGIYADNRVGGASTTGVGEIAISHLLSKRVCDLMREGSSPEKAAWKGVAETIWPGGYQGSICVMALDRNGNYGAATSSKRGFPYAYFSEDMEEPQMLEAPIVAGKTP